MERRRRRGEGGQAADEFSARVRWWVFNSVERRVWLTVWRQSMFTDAANACVLRMSWFASPSFLPSAWEG